MNIPRQSEIFRGYEVLMRSTRIEEETLLWHRTDIRRGMQRILLTKALYGSQSLRFDRQR